MGRNRTRLLLSTGELADLRRGLRAAKDEREKERLRVVLWAARGQHTLEDLACMAGRARATIQTWLDKFKEGAIPGLLKRDTPPGTISPVRDSEVQAQLRAGVKAGRWRSAREVAVWLKDAHGIERATKSVYYWLSKISSVEERNAR